ncbi:helix-turn-helix transcriptional regulator [Actinomadura terrae]|uniref:helix-turn-helix transcriptional regulator n=1 Tax=Actinomadura terrae TaxID=604353 RepID=UPI001FA6CF00|nr:response regulator transcription factor [Actinomadura terrae]
MTSILLSSANADCRDRVAGVLGRTLGAQVRLVVPDGRSVASALVATATDLLVVDLTPWRAGHRELVRSVCREGSVLRVPVVLLVDHTARFDEPAGRPELLGALWAGVASIADRRGPVAEVTAAARTAAAGGRYLSPAFARCLLDDPVDGPALLDELFEADPHRPGVLTPREREVLALLASRPSNAWIAERLALSEKTVKYHVSNVLGKLGLRDRGEAAELAAAMSPDHCGTLAS